LSCTGRRGLTLTVIRRKKAGLLIYQLNAKTVFSW
jgi:hypothetical protein